MKKNSSIQIQAVLYNNKKDELERAMLSMEQAILVNRRNEGHLSDFRYVVGDASANRIYTEEEVEKIRERFMDTFGFSYTFFGFNSGSAKGQNLLGKNCDSDYMMYTNPDVLLCPRFFLEIVKPFIEQGSAVGIAEGRQTPIEHPKEYDPASGETGWASGACSVFPTELYRDVGGFDEESFFMYCDDVDFSWRVRLRGNKIIYQPHAMAFHAKRLSDRGAWQPSKAERYFSAEAALIIAYKWSNVELCERILQMFLQSADEDQQKAAQVFEEKRACGRLPAQLDEQHAVAEFIGNNYTEHRFVL